MKQHLLPALFFSVIIVLSVIGHFAKVQQTEVLSSKTAQASPTPKPIIVPEAKTLQNDYHIFQSFNNCGPASLSMMLSYFGVEKSQEELGEELRPYQNAQGINDDKSVTMEEITNKAAEFNLVAYHRPNGDIELLKEFIANDIPVLTRTWLTENEDIGHYRIVKGYDAKTETLIQDDSYQDKNLSYSYESFNNLWEKFNFEYVVLVPKEKQMLAEKIIGEDVDKHIAWQNAVTLSQKKLEKNPDDMYARFNLSVAYYNLGEYQKTVAEFEKVENQLPFRTLWYQIEPLLAYYELRKDDKVLELTDHILSNENAAFAELYLIRGKIYEKQKNLELAKQEFEYAILYNKHLEEAQKSYTQLNS